MAVQNIIFDVDGTLWDTTEIVSAAWNDAIKVNGSSGVHTTPERLKQLFGKPMNVIGDLLFTDVREETREKLLDDCVEYEQRALEQRELKILYPGVAETLKALAETGKNLFIVSNCQSGYIELFLQKNNFETLVSDFECYGDTGLSKGENIRLLMERNGLQSTDTVYVGDTQGDYDATQRAGIPFIFAAYGFGAVDADCRSIERFEELLSI